MNTLVVITSPAEPGVVIQLDARVAQLLGMTSKFISQFHPTPRGFGLSSTR